MTGLTPWVMFIESAGWTTKHTKYETYRRILPFVVCWGGGPSVACFVFFWGRQSVSGTDRFENSILVAIHFDGDEN